MVSLPQALACSPSAQMNHRLALQCCCHLLGAEVGGLEVVARPARLRPPRHTDHLPAARRSSTAVRRAMSAWRRCWRWGMLRLAGIAPDLAVASTGSAKRRLIA